MTFSTESETALAALVAEVGACRICVERPQGAPLPHEPRPVLRVSPRARLLIAGQAPGMRVHRSGLPFDDPSGDRLRDWMGVDRETFYDVSRIGVAAMSFCFPGYDAHGGDLPPRRECAPHWRDALFSALPRVETILAVGKYAQAYHLRRLGVALRASASVAETVGRWRELSALTPKIIPLPHPSWRNTGWLKRNPWFAAELLPVVRVEVARLAGADGPGESGSCAAFGGDIASQRES
ncbi:uracil-DNA glycosylase [Methylosinus sp. C49]|uniref:uracil-DNA glycosylase family protein n=1 Tax=Methylosinus sp. C49 TaxID=2699395 RepID=UPI001366C3D8|nr:uracil-DNA glycosylase family protein [Methylosinus sp. C49]BBU61020.1 uracil-DNA glycosylase [Methylosinus sp. C49]